MAHLSRKNCKMQIEPRSQSWRNGRITTCLAQRLLLNDWLKKRDAIIKPADWDLCDHSNLITSISCHKTGRTQCLLRGLMWKHNMWVDSYCTESQLQLKDTLSVCFFAILWVCWCLFCLCVCQVQVQQGNWDIYSFAVKIAIKQVIVICLPTRDGAAAPQPTVAKQPAEPFTAHELPQQPTLREEYNSGF